MSEAVESGRWRDLFGPAMAPRAALVVLGIWLNAADGMVTATIMPSVARDLGGFVYFAWAVVGFQLGCILAAASAGRLAERLGLRTAMILAASLYALGCALSAAAGAIGVFLAGRLLQGVGAGWIVGLTYVAIGAMFPERLWSRVFGLGAGVWGVASLLGPLVGGVFAAAGHWRWVFSGFAAQGVVFAFIAARLLPRRADPGADAPRPLPWRTLMVLTAAVVCISAADVTAGVVAGLILTAAGVGLIALALRVNAAPSEGLVPRHAADLATPAGAGYATILVFSAATAGGIYLAAILQTQYHLSPLAAGYVVAMDAFGWTAAAFVVAGQPQQRHSAFILAGATTIVAAIAATAAVIGTGNLVLVIAATTLLGVGFGLSWALLTQRILASLTGDDRAIGASAVPTLQLVGGAAGAAAAGAIANLLGLARAFTADNAARQGPWLFTAFVPVAALGWLAAWRLTRPARA